MEGLTSIGIRNVINLMDEVELDHQRKPFRPYHERLKGILRISQDSYCQTGNRSLVEKLGSLVRLTPTRLNPASSPGVGMWVM
jgi:hypothetical protein